MGTGGTLSGNKAAEAWSWPVTSIQNRGQKWWGYITSSSYVFMACCLLRTGTN
jgi:hypothetical protein